MNTRNLQHTETQFEGLWLFVLFTVSSFLAAPNLTADPCGMVPPVQASADDAIKRVGAQKTYLFYRDGIESFVVRPGFSGKVDNFGMLIPFPKVPSIRKVPNNIFPQIAAAIDPPEITVRRAITRLERSAALNGAGAAENRLSVKKNEVRVKKKEAVGMYQTAVLEAGSADALKRWMDEHGYTYPGNMDEATQDYVKAGWCFVAVKARVATKSSADPKPGMREANPGLPADASFDGNVQAMGFRFRTDELVAPMRLSAHNKGKLHNITYVLTDGPKRINDIPKEMVKRQVSGEQLYRNVTQPLPVRVIGGKWENLSENRRERIREQRDPDPKNGRAKELFRSDLLAAMNERLVHGYETDMKALLDVEEALDLRGEAIDELNRNYLSDRNKRARQHALKQLKDMTLTVVDGNFPRDVLKRQNLRVSTYRMPASENTSAVYNARQKGPVDRESRGNLYRGDPAKPVQKKNGILLLSLLLTSILLMGGSVTYLRPSHANKTDGRQGYASGQLLFLTTVVAGVILGGLPLTAEVNVQEQIERLTNRDTAQQAVRTLVENEEASRSKLIRTAREARNVKKRGWAMVALARMGGDVVETTLEKILNDGGEPELIRTLAAAARIRASQRIDDIKGQVDLIDRFPPVARTFRKQYRRITRKHGSPDAQLLLSLATQSSELRDELREDVMAFGADRLTERMLNASENQVRRTAASFLGALAQQNDRQTVIRTLRSALAFDVDANEVPWNGGALFLPRISWTKSGATPIVRNLLSWMIRAHETGQQQVMQQIHNNLRSVRLRRAVGYDVKGQGIVNWLTSWKQARGEQELRKLLNEQQLLDRAPYKHLLD